MIEVTQIDFYVVWLISFCGLALRYALFAGLAFYMLYYATRLAYSGKRLRSDSINMRHVVQDIGWSAISFIIFGVMIAGIMHMSGTGYTKLYTDVHQFGIGFVVIGLVVLLLAHDAYFYWMHRLLHTRWFYRHVHFRHHRPSPPTPFTSFAFHPIEAVLEFAFIIPMVFLFPFHPITLFLFANMMTAMNVWGHLGVELMPQRFLRKWYGSFFNSTTHHDMHHQYNKGNYGLYFSLWDHVMKTHHPKYLDKRNQYNVKLKTKAGDDQC